MYSTSPPDSFLASLKDLTGNFTVGLLLLGGCAVLGAIVVASLDREHGGR
jgi:hypothetical protein